jgi:predicted nucleic-acid-binding protein
MMIAGSIDTNVLVRLVAQDDPLQAKVVDRLFERHAKRSEMLMVPVTVVLELEWVLRARLIQTKAQVLDAMEALLTMVELSFESEDAVEQALMDYREGNADFGECLHLALARKGRALPFYTFDKKAARAIGATVL